MSSAEPIDEYLAKTTPAQRAALTRLRKTIRASAPRAEECISYGLPAFRQDGALVAYGATKRHCALYLMSATTAAAHARELEGYDTSKGTVRFAPDEPLPATLVRKLVRARLAENAASRKGKGAKRASNSASTARVGSTRPSKPAPRSPAADVKTVLASIEALGTQRDRDNLGRFGIVAPKSFGVSMANLRVLAKRYGRDHELAQALWETGWYEARMLATLVDEPARVTPAQMERWCRDFDNWAICDTACFALFDRTPHAWTKVAAWRARPGEYQKRAAFALLASLALHDKTSPDALFLACLPYVEEASDDARNFVKKGVNWALRGVGRRNPRLNAAATAVARRLAASRDATARWIGKDALREFAKVAAKRAAKS